ncbi:hypothetical protein CO051_02440 [Candidatus Roizmanbacteria bacterium CG_4_9_14_0_2_um_filter_39_13]|uniref:LytR/CpsA/Psr regulator C-terminal domain-containing protein n=1 Tax=Candidatus Roizmanbacteria bacterium CG_4_9_14_0_2_um_filter_39_13 TaxID=1974839 RepID=A0A2M8F0R4_9BACT|nr:MAG: hypothetical protein COY15_02040 [Candidatus Roizmanbacteria bacterium CG_4_10_14_0_2_um_filter_39_12]PJC32840.1 MAG: hypothetical protein CO051_02440 [Candidatus Roizmanbacteria bacterium CG_4_9_14_0_2_um_filter_39_13]
MLYVYLDSSQIKLMLLKKSLLGQYESSFVKKSLQEDLLKDGLPVNPDVIASGLKEALSGFKDQPIKEKDVTLILPQEAFLFFREDMPIDIADAVLETYLREKARAHLNSDIDNSHFDYLIRESEGKKKVLFYAIKKEALQAYQKPLSLLDFNLKSIIPEPLTYFKLFEKTLRPNKKENIWYVSYDQDKLSGYVYDSFGLLEEKRWTATIAKTKKIEDVLQKQVAVYEAKSVKLNRLILSGAQSDDVRQDTFTKNVGVWTNPIKRIIPHFYADYLKMLRGQNESELPILTHDMLIGGFIFASEDKQFSMYKSTNKSIGSSRSKPSFSLPTIPVPKKIIFLFALSFLITFGILFGLAQMNTNMITLKIPSIAFPSFASPTPTPIPTTPTPNAPTPTPTPEVVREELKIKVLNGSGIRGKAGIVKDFLTDAGYEDIITANAAAFDYEITVIQFKKGQEATRDLVSEDIASEIEDKVVFETLAEDEAADIVIIVGTDFK